MRKDLETIIYCKLLNYKWFRKFIGYERPSERWLRIAKTVIDKDAKLRK